MQIIEIFADTDGYAPRRDHSVEDCAKVADRAMGTVDVTVPNSRLHRSDGYFVDWKPSPRNVLFAITPGFQDYETADGLKRLWPGDIVISTDTTVRGKRVSVPSHGGRLQLGVSWHRPS